MIYECYNSDRQETALIHHGFGLPIVLCRGNSPINTDWRVRDYSPAEIEREFQECANLNVGLVLGPRYGLIEVFTLEGDGNQSHREFYDLMDGVFPETPTFESRYGCHRIFGWDQGLGSLGRAELKYKSVLIRIGAGEGAFTLLPPSRIDGVRRKWRLTIGDYDGDIARLPDYAVDTIIAAQSDVKCA